MKSITSAARLTALCIALGSVAALTACAQPKYAERQMAGEVVDDSWITTKVKSLYVEDPTVRALAIKVETYRGTVQLSGFANSPEEMNRAVSIARSVKGVKAVTNDMRLKTM